MARLHLVDIGEERRDSGFETLTLARGGSRRAPRLGGEAVIRRDELVDPLLQPRGLAGERGVEALDIAGELGFARGELGLERRDATRRVRALRVETVAQRADMAIGGVEMLAQRLDAAAQLGAGIAFGGAQALGFDCDLGELALELGVAGGETVGARAELLDLRQLDGEIRLAVRWGGDRLGARLTPQGLRHLLARRGGALAQHLGRRQRRHGRDIRRSRWLGRTHIRATLARSIRHAGPPPNRPMPQPCRFGQVTGGGRSCAGEPCQNVDDPGAPPRPGRGHRRRLAATTGGDPPWCDASSSSPPGSLASPSPRRHSQSR
jgi:hypothetical protein